jgi:DNA invertase Pin-like site-specific DNA recombinase
MTAVLIYTRLSTEDVHDATTRQEVACRSYAQARNWDVAATLSDLDASAYQPRAHRPGFETLITEAAARSADGVLVWKLDRLVRRPKDFERLWEVAERRSVFIALVTEPVDSSSPIGLAMLRILVALAGLESATTGIRVRASKRQAAEEGKPPPVKAYGLTLPWDESSTPRRPCCVKPPTGQWPANAWRRLHVTCGHGESRHRRGAYGRMRRSVGSCAIPGWWVTVPTRGRLLPGTAGRRSWIATHSLACN